MIKQAGKLLLLLIVANAWADAADDPCAGASALLNMVDRPTVADSACVVPHQKAVMELGYQYQQLTTGAGYQQNLPEAVLRIGLPSQNEFVVVLPNFTHQSMPPYSGLQATTVGIKHEIGYTASWLATAETLLTLPSGSTAYGSNGLGVALNGIVTYTLNSMFNLSFMLGGSTQSASSDAGGQHYTSINPDVVFTYAPTERANLYVEVYGQTKTSPTHGSGFNMDMGMLYLLLPSMTADLEVGQRISGNLTGFEHYVGAGLALIF